MSHTGRYAVRSEAEVTKDRTMTQKVVFKRIEDVIENAISRRVDKQRLRRPR